MSLAEVRSRRCPSHYPSNQYRSKLAEEFRIALRPTSLLAPGGSFGEQLDVIKRRAIHDFSRAVARRFHPQKIILFGSYAYGKPTEDSDVDLLVVMPRTRQGGKRMSVRIRHAVPRAFPLDLLVRTPEDISSRLREGDCFTREIMDRGQVLHEAGQSATLREAKSALKHCRSLRTEVRRSLGLKD